MTLSLACLDNVRKHARHLHSVFVLLTALFTSQWASATQHLVQPGKDWEQLAAQCRPGDEIVLMPGEHRSATLKDLTGTDENPIVIRGIDPQHPAVFRKHRQALTLVDARNVVLENMVFEYCELSAIVVTVVTRHADAPKARTVHPPGHVEMRNIRIDRTGPDANARPIIINGMDRVTIEECTFDGWTGRAIECIATTRSVVRQCTFTGRAQYDAELAISMRGGTTDSDVVSCQFNNAGATAAVSLGGKSKIDQLPAIRNSDSTSQPLFEVSKCRISRCIFVDQPCPIMLSHAVECVIRDCTFVRPRRWVCALLSLHDDARMAISVRPVFANNLLAWHGGDLTGLFLVDTTTRKVKLVLESNLWWSDEDPAVRSRMIPTIVEEAWPQVVNMNPQLDENHQPSNSDASIYGANAD